MSIIKAVTSMLKKRGATCSHTTPQRAQLPTKPTSGNKAYCFFLSKPTINFDYEVQKSDGQLLFSSHVYPKLE